MSRDGEQTEEERSYGRLRRRGVLRSVGVGAAFSVGGYGVASQDGDEGTPTEGEQEGPVDRRCDPCIDTVTGYQLLDGAQEPEETLQADHLVDMRVADVDVLFRDPGNGEAEGADAGETPTGNETAIAGNETATGDNETAVGDNETAVEGNETAAGEGAEPQAGGEQQTGFPDFFFDPVGLTVRPGEVVEFRTMQAEVPAPGGVVHTVTAFHPRTGHSQRVPQEVPGFSSPPVFAGESWFYQFDTEGVYDLLCLPHLSLGMVMRVVVRAEDGEAVPEEPPDLETTESMVPPNAVTVLAAPELDPANVLEQGQVAWTDLSDLSAQPPGGPGGGQGDGEGPANEGDDAAGEGA